MSDPHGANPDNIIPVGAQNVNWDFIRPFEHTLFDTIGDKVWSGPFAGMQIPRDSGWSDGAVSTKLFGTYETELHETVRAAVARNPKVVFNIGCAEGFYAIGLARLLPEAMVYAVDINKVCLDLCREYAEKNGVLDRMFFRYGAHLPDELAFPHAQGQRLYFLDCETAEFTLLDPEKCPVLKYSDIVVEYHDKLGKGDHADLIDRFMPTHTVVSIKALEDPPLICEMSVKFQYVMHTLRVSDKRYDGNAWLALWAKELR